MRKNGNTGKITIPAGVAPERHELETAAILAKFGHDVTFIMPSRTKGAKTPDIEMDGIDWEMKCPTGGGRRTIEHAIRNASKLPILFLTFVK